MNPQKPGGRRFQFLGRRQTKTNAMYSRQLFRRRHPMHDPMLVLNMSIFNFEDGWSRIFNPIYKSRN
jgi:hypothetical protein